MSRALLVLLAARLAAGYVSGYLVCPGVAFLAPPSSISSSPVSTTSTALLANGIEACDTAGASCIAGDVYSIVPGNAYTTELFAQVALLGRMGVPTDSDFMYNSSTVFVSAFMKQ